MQCAAPQQRLVQLMRRREARTIHVWRQPLRTRMGAMAKRRRWQKDALGNVMAPIAKMQWNPRKESFQGRAVLHDDESS